MRSISTMRGDAGETSLAGLLWLFGRKLEHDAGVSGSLRDATGKSGNPFSRAW